MELKDVLARNLKRYRKVKNLSQEELAYKSGMSTRSYGKIERREVHTSLDKLEMLSIGTQLSAVILIDESFELEE